MGRELTQLVVAAAAVTLLASCGSDTESATATSTVTVTVMAPGIASPVAPVQADAAAIGQEVRDGNFAFTVTKVDLPRKSIGEQSTQGNYVVVYLSVTNTGNEPQQFDEFYQLLIDAAGRKYNYDINATGALDLEQDGDVDFKGRLNPTASDVFAVVFDLPSDAKAAAIELHGSQVSSGVAVKL